MPSFPLSIQDTQSRRDSWTKPVAKTPTPTSAPTNTKSRAPTNTKSRQGVYWVGQDGNVYVRESGVNGVANYGPSATLAANSFDALNGLKDLGYDPAVSAGPGKDASTGNNNVYGNTGGGSEYADTSAERAITQSALDQLGGVLKTRLGNDQAAYDSVIKDYDAEMAKNKARYDEEVNSNEGTLARNESAALLAAAQGGRGLRAVLASLGALGGSGKVLANRAIKSEANADIGEANRSFKANAKQLSSAWSDTEADDKKRRAKASDELFASQQQSRYDVASSKQGILEKMMGLWEDAGNTAMKNTVGGQIAALQPELAGYAGRRTANYDRGNLAFDAGKLSEYLAGNRDLSVSNSGGTTPANSPLRASYATKRKEEV